MKQWVTRIKALRPVRAWRRFTEVRGNLLAAGIAYFAFFSLFPALALAAVVFGFVLGGHPELLDAVGRSLDGMLPGLVKTAAHPEGILELTPPTTGTLSVAGVVAFVGLVLGGLGWVGSMRAGIRAVFEVPGEPGNLLTNKLRDLVVFALLGASVLASALLGTVAGGLAGALADRLGWHGTAGTWLVGLAGLVVALLANVGVLVLVLRVLSGVHLPGPALRSGALVGGVALTLLQLFGTQVVALGTRNPLFGSIVVVVGLLFWLNLVAQVVLVAAAWAAGDLRDGRGGPSSVGDSGDSSGTADSTRSAGPSGPALGPGGVSRRLDDSTSGVRVDAHDARERARHGIPAVGQRTAERSTLAAGALLGAAATGLIGGAWRGLRTLVRGAR